MRAWHVPKHYSRAGRSALKAREELILCAGEYGKKPMNFLQVNSTSPIPAAPAPMCDPESR